MSAIRGTIRDGKVVLDEPTDWPEGKEVLVTERAETQSARAHLPDDEDSSPGAIAERLALMDQFQAWMTPEELAAWERVRSEDKAFQLAQWDKWTKSEDAS